MKYGDKQIMIETDESEILKLSEELKKSTDATVVLRCDNTLPIQELVNILEIGNKLQIKMILATKTINATTK